MKRLLIFVLTLCALSSQAAVYQNYYVTNPNPALSILGTNAVIGVGDGRYIGNGSVASTRRGTNTALYNSTNYFGTTGANSTNRTPYWTPDYTSSPGHTWFIEHSPFGDIMSVFRNDDPPNNGRYFQGSNFLSFQMHGPAYGNTNPRMTFLFQSPIDAGLGWMMTDTNFGYAYQDGDFNNAYAPGIEKDLGSQNELTSLTFGASPFATFLRGTNIIALTNFTATRMTNLHNVAYNSVTWNGNLGVPTLDSIRDKFEGLPYLTNGDTRNIGLMGEVTVSNVFKVVDAGNTDTAIFTVDIFGGITIGDSKVSLGPYDGIVTATGGFHSRSNVYTLMPTNLASANDVIIATGVSGGDTVHTKYGAASGTGSLTDIQTNGTTLLANATKVNIAAGQNITVAGSISGTIGTVTVGVNTNFDTLNVGTLNLTNPVPLAAGGTGASLTDPNADRILFWDDSAGAVDWLIPGSNLSITDKTLNASGGGASFPMLWGDVGNTTFLDRDDTTEIGGMYFGPTNPDQLAFGVDVGESKMYHVSGVAALTTTADGVEYRGSFHNFYSGGDSLAQLTAAHSALYADNGAYAVDLKSGGELEVISSDLTIRTVGHEVIASDATSMVLSNTTAGLAGIKLKDNTVTVTGSFVPTETTLTDAATIATDASVGNDFIVTLGGNRTLGNPTNPTHKQEITWWFVQDGTGSRTITLDTKFGFGTDITGVTLTTTAGKRDKLKAEYDSVSDKWYVTGFIRGY